MNCIRCSNINTNRAGARRKCRLCSVSKVSRIECHVSPRLALETSSVRVVVVGWIILRRVSRDNRSMPSVPVRERIEESTDLVKIRCVSPPYKGDGAWSKSKRTGAQSDASAARPRGQLCKELHLCSSLRHDRLPGSTHDSSSFA